MIPGPVKTTCTIIRLMSIVILGYRKHSQEPVVTYELLPKGEEAPINEHSRFGAYLVDVQWAEGEPKPVVTIEAGRHSRRGSRLTGESLSGRTTPALTR